MGKRAQDLVDSVGLPSEKYASIIERIRVERIEKFLDVQTMLLDWLWCVDAYRIAGVVPPDFAAGPTRTTGDALSGSFYRNRGDRFSDILTMLLRNRTSLDLAPRSRVKGFSQEHQIDIAWSPTIQDVLSDPVVCCEVKILGAPGDGTKPDRNIRNDWSNRRKELKFQAADLKLFQGRDDPRIRNWDQWRTTVSPRVYTIWAGRVFSESDVAYMIDQARDLTDTYLDGVAVFPFAPRLEGQGYEPRNDGRSVRARLTNVDTVLGRIAADIEQLSGSR